ncbi:TATA box-binding protein-associated factor RNA polymerase I subunit B isoform X2 [Parambassis ranga]|uniref:TATA box-binding protein-associated factor RNA polymerase I subunit B isoform X2 n=1 Tax=Parambassis ranga TaxID=210632 RepID=A0A6P7HPX7_9TELE|nr:TATA box-binding protein-associated factor RNA polymerase I subunit B isoform X2 [Parambassis ranga]
MDDVLCPLWRLYLQRSRQAYTAHPLRSSQHRVRDSDSDSAAESIRSVTVTDGESNPPSTAGSNADSGSELSGSVDAAFYLTRRRSRGVMSMKKNLALIYLALVWSREALTLSDLLRLVNEGHVPYVDAYEQLPEEMKLTGKDALLFRVKSVPSHRTVHKEAQALTQLLQLPAFPAISSQTLLHPALLSLRYLTEANLPDELHPWVCRLVECAGMADQTLHTFDPVSCPRLPCYDVRAAALIIVTIKVIFGMDDHTECDLCNGVDLHDDSGDGFNLRRWHRLMKVALTRAEQKAEQDIARKRWTTERPVYQNKKEKVCLTKRKRIAEQVQLCFEKLSSCPADVRSASPSSFRFCWGDEDGSDGPSLQHMKLDGLVTLKRDAQTPSNCTYWHPALRPCSRWKCSSHYSEMEALLPRSFVWLLQLFCFLLDVEPHCLYEEVLSVERRLFSSKTPRDRVRRGR